MVIQTRLADFGATGDDFDFKNFIQTFVSSFFLVFAFAFATLGISNFIQFENVSELKRLQYMAGANRFAYWFANICFDYIQYLVTAGILFLCLHISKLRLAGEMPMLAAALIPYGLLAITFVYLCGFFFRRQMAIFRVQLISLLIFFILTFVLTSLVLANRSCEKYRKKYSSESYYQNRECEFGGVKYVITAFDILPMFYVADVIYWIAFTAIDQDLSRHENMFDLKDTLAWDNMGSRLFICIFMSVMYFGLVLILDVKDVQKNWNCACECCKKCCCSCCRTQHPEERQNLVFNDPDVQAEQQRAMGPSGNARLAVRDLQYRYPGANYNSVDGVSFVVEESECFGLLGVNGAGKTTTFSMLTGTMRPTNGTAEIEGVNIFDHPRKVICSKNYCPQDNVLFDLLTPREHLQLFTTLNGVPCSKQNQYINALVSEVGLEEHKNKKVSELSGGNKRKVQFALSLIGYRNVIFMDEPTTGMDPGARRNVWRCIQRAIKSRGVSVVLTSHSMDECEALCNRLLIMVAGKIRCVGSVQHLKNKFGNQYIVKVKCGSIDRLDSVQAHLAKIMPTALLTERHSNVLSYKVPGGGNLSQLFTLLNHAKSVVPIEDFSVSQTTLEQVFVNMAETQELLYAGGRDLNFAADGQLVLV